MTQNDIYMRVYTDMIVKYHACRFMSIFLYFGYFLVVVIYDFSFPSNGIAENRHKQPKQSATFIKLVVHTQIKTAIFIFIRVCDYVCKFIQKRGGSFGRQRECLMQERKQMAF